MRLTQLSKQPNSLIKSQVFHSWLFCCHEFVIHCSFIDNRNIRLSHEEKCSKKISGEIKYDVDFVRSYQLQPGWYKLFKVILLLGVLIGYAFFFGWKRILIFLAVFLLLSLAVHLLYRKITQKFTRSWLDFKVIVEQGKFKSVSIGVVYYLLIFFNVVLAFLISQGIII